MAAHTEVTADRCAAGITSPAKWTFQRERCSLAAKTRRLDAKHQKAVVKQLEMINAYLFDQTNHAIARATLISVRFYVAAFSSDEQRAPIP